MEKNCIFFDKRFKQNCILKESEELEDDEICEFCLAKYILLEGQTTTFTETRTIQRKNGKIITLLED